MKIALIIPSAHDVYRQITRSSKRQPSLGAAYLTAAAMQAGLDITLLDADALDYIGDAAVTRLLAENPDLIGISLTTPLVSEGIALAAGLRARGYRGHLTLGGAHPSALPAETLALIPGADSVVIGEGEQTLVELARAIEAGMDLTAVPGLAIRTSAGEVALTPARPLVADLDSLPMPALEQLPMERYVSPMWGDDARQRMGVLITSRGCPGRCEFCASHMLWGRRVRYHSIERVVAEVRRLVQQYAVDYLVFNDDTFTLQKSRCLAILHALEEAGLRRPFMVTSRVDTVDTEFLTALQHAGCFLITYGIESGSEYVLRAIHKNITLDQVRRAVQAARDTGIKVVGNFMFGHWPDTVESCRATLEFASELHCDISQFAVCIPYPGSELYQRAMEHGLLLPTGDYRDFGYYGNMPWIHPNLTREELLAFQREAYSG